MERLHKLGVTTLTVEPDIASADLNVLLKAWRDKGPIQGVYWLPALDVEPDLEDVRPGNLARTQPPARQKSVHNDAGALRIRPWPEHLPGLGYATRRAARLRHGGPRPLGGAVLASPKPTTSSKGCARRPGLPVKAEDFEVSRKTADLAGQLITETLFDPGVVEVGYHNGWRYAITLVEKPAKDGNPA